MLSLLAAVMLSQTQTQSLSTSAKNGGAPLGDPDVAVHVVEKKDYSDSGGREVTLFPAAVQVNGKFTQHYGVAGAFTWHLHENFALTVMGQWNYANAESSFNTELTNKTSTEAQAATSLLLVGGALAGVEVTPFYGKFALFENHLVHFSLVLNGAAGAGATRHQLKPDNSGGPATFGDTGWRFLAEVGGGLRVRLGEWVSVRLELRDLIYAARVTTVDGCDANDATAIADGVGSVSAGCNAGAMSKTDAALAKALLKNPSSDVLNNLGVYAGASLDF